MHGCARQIPKLRPSCLRVLSFTNRCDSSVRQSTYQGRHQCRQIVEEERTMTSESRRREVKSAGMQIATGAAGAVFAVIVLSAVDLVWNTNLIPSLENYRIPKGTVIMTMAEDCSTLSGDWIRYGKADGRFPIAAGQTTDAVGDNKQLFIVAQTGGTYKHSLAPDEMPPHAHTYSVREMRNRAQRCGGDCARAMPSLQVSSTGSAGMSLPHNNTPPYVVLRFCIRQ